MQGDDQQSSTPELPLTRRELRRRRDAAARTTAEEPPPANSEFALSGIFSSPETTPEGTPTILFVCTGNICRSALSEVVLRARLRGLDVKVHSSGMLRCTSA